jgi:hypothetical protein
VAFLALKLSTGRILLVRGSREAVRHLQHKPHIGQKTYGQGRGITAGGGGWLDEGVRLVSDLSDSSGYTKRVRAGAEVPTHRGTSARIEARTVKMRGEECGDLRFF